MFHRDKGVEETEQSKGGLVGNVSANRGAGGV